MPFVKEWEAKRQQELVALEQKQLERQRQRDSARFVFIAPKVDMKAPKPPERAELSDLDRRARTVERADKPTNNMPFARGNTPERMESAGRETQPARATTRVRGGGSAVASGRDASRVAVGAGAQVG